MEPLWSPAVATSRNRWQMGRRRERLRQAKIVAVDCDQLPESFHGKEGVDSSSPSEGFAKPLRIRGVFHVIVAISATVGRTEVARRQLSAVTP